MTVGWFKKGFFLAKLDVGKPSTKTSGLNVNGTITLTSGSITATTGTFTGKTASFTTVTASSRVTGSKGLTEGVQKLSHSTGQAALNTFGLSVLSATAASTYTLGPPPAAGTIKHITMATGAANLTVKTTASFVGTTRKTINMVGGKALTAPTQNGRLCAVLIGATGGKWALVSYATPTTAFTIA